MRFELKINHKETANPFVRFVVGLASLAIGILVLFLVLFALLPVFWFLMLAVILLVLSVLSSLPRLKIYYYDACKKNRSSRKRLHD